MQIQAARGKTREKRRRFVPRGEGLSSNRSIPETQGSPADTFGRFSVRGPAAWRKDGGTGKNCNTMCKACKALRYMWWSGSHYHKRSLVCFLRGRMHCGNRHPMSVSGLQNILQKLGAGIIVVFGLGLSVFIFSRFFPEALPVWIVMPLLIAGFFVFVFLAMPSRNRTNRS